jgi:hypothetical protein
MGIAVSVPSSNTKAAVQVPIDQTTDNTIINTGTVNILLCEQNTFGPDATYVLQSGAALPWEHETCWAVVQSGTIQGSLWATTLLFYGTTAPSVVIVSQVPPEFISILNAAAPTAPWSVQIAGIAGKILSLFYITVCPGNVTGSICGIAMQSTATSVPVLNFVFNTGDSPVSIPYGVFQLPIGEGLEFSVAGSSGQMSAVICYSQA